MGRPQLTASGGLCNVDGRSAPWGGGARLLAPSLFEQRCTSTLLTTLLARIPLEELQPVRGVSDVYRGVYRSRRYEVTRLRSKSAAATARQVSDLTRALTGVGPDDSLTALFR